MSNKDKSSKRHSITLLSQGTGMPSAVVSAAAGTTAGPGSSSSSSGGGGGGSSMMAMSRSNTPPPSFLLHHASHTNSALLSARNRHSDNVDHSGGSGSGSGSVVGGVNSIGMTLSGGTSATSVSTTTTTTTGGAGAASVGQNLISSNTSNWGSNFPNSSSTSASSERARSDQPPPAVIHANLKDTYNASIQFIRQQGQFISNMTHKLQLSRKMRNDIMHPLRRLGIESQQAASAAAHESPPGSSAFSFGDLASLSMDDVVQLTDVKLITKALHPFTDADFNPALYTNSVFSQMDATTELAGVVSNLRATEQSVAQELRLCVDENYPKFIGASAEFACFEIDIINFGTLLRELNSSTKEISERTSVVRKLIQHTDFVDQSDSHSPRLSNIPSSNTSTRPQSRIRPEDEALSDLIDELELAIALFEWHRAVQFVRQGRLAFEKQQSSDHNSNSGSTQTSVLVSRFQRAVDDLCAAMSRLLASPHRSHIRTSRDDDPRHLVQMLTILGRADEARRIFLESRSEWLKAEIRGIHFRGSVVNYAAEISSLEFSVLSDTWSEFLRTISHNNNNTGSTDNIEGGIHVSQFIEWLYQELHFFVDLFKRQILVYTDNFQTVSECFFVMCSHARKLQAHGLNIVFYIWKLLDNDLARSLSNYLEEIQKKLQISISKDQWQGKIVEYKSTQAILSTSGKKLLLCIQKLLHETASVVSPKTTPIIARGIANLVGKYIERCTESATELALNDHQYFSLMSNVMFILGTLIPDISEKFWREFKREAVELQSVATGFEGLIPELFDNFVLTRGEHFSKIRLPFSEPLKSGYPRSSMAPRDGKSAEISGVTESFMSMFVFVARLAEELRLFFFGRVNSAIKVENLIGKHSNWSSTSAIIGTLLDNTATSFLESDLWDRLLISKDDHTVSRELRLTPEDVNQIILDLKFFRKCAEMSLSGKNQPNLVVSMRESITRNADSIVSKVITSYCSANKLRIDQIVQSSDWFDRLITKAMERKIVLETDAVGMPISDRTFPFGEILRRIAATDAEQSSLVLMNSVLSTVTANSQQSSIADEDWD